MRRTLLLIVLALCSSVAVAMSPVVTSPATSSAISSVSMAIHVGTGHIVVPASINGDGPHWFILDTGAQQTTINAQLAERLELETEPLGSMGGAGTGTIEVRSTKNVRVSVGEATGDEAADRNANIVEPMVVVIPQEAALGDFEGRPVQGILGGTLIRQYITTIDYAAARLTFADREGYQPPEAATVMTIKLSHGFPYFEGAVIPSINGEATEAVTGNFLLDLGAPHAVMLDFEPAKSVGLVDADDPEQRAVGTGAGIDGGRFSWRSAPVRSIVLGGHTLEDPALEFMTSPGGGPPIRDLVGAVGSACFRGCALTLDYAGGRVLVMRSQPS